MTILVKSVGREVIEMAEMKCPICGKVMVEKQFKKNRNNYWQCLDCKITVDILYALEDDREDNVYG